MIFPLKPVLVQFVALVSILLQIDAIKIAVINGKKMFAMLELLLGIN